MSGLPSMSGDTVDRREQLAGRLVSFLLTNGFAVCVVRVVRVDDRIWYRLPDSVRDSAVSWSSVGHMHVFPVDTEPVVQAAPGWHAAFGYEVRMPRGAPDPTAPLWSVAYGQPQARDAVTSAVRAHRWCARVGEGVPGEPLEWLEQIAVNVLDGGAAVDIEVLWRAGRALTLQVRDDAEQQPEPPR